MTTKTTKRTKRAAADFPVPQTHQDADAAIARIGRLQRERTNIETRMNSSIAAIKEKYETAAKPLKAELEGLSKGVQTYCEAHRVELTEDGRRKTCKFGAGAVSWRTSPPKVSLKGVEQVIERIRGLKLDRFLRVKTEVDKEAMLKEPDVAGAIEGVTIAQGEDFVIKPFETELEEVRS